MWVNLLINDHFTHIIRSGLCYALILIFFLPCRGEDDEDEDDLSDLPDFPDLAEDSGTIGGDLDQVDGLEELETDNLQINHQGAGAGGGGGGTAAAPATALDKKPGNLTEA